MSVRVPLMAVLLILLSSMIVLAGDSKKDIKERMKERYATLKELKEKGKVGETHLGYVEAVNPKEDKDKAIEKIVSGENADREMLYEIIAKDAKTTPEAVGKQNAFRIFSKAEDDEYFKGEDGKWRQKKDLKAEKQKKTD